ncbi:MAG: hypothetical protein B6D79_01545 [gamma proteobacterium symbiont of Ctena orbiculata]|nr:MAG: hypothetical protein B6D79_01545 [gamma proteobacterium symbiont of Ctena orbiculata]
MAELEALIFDVDGTLADTERDGHRVAFNRAFEDSHNGVQSASHAAIDSILVTTNGYTAEDDFSGASLVVDQFGEPDQPFLVRSGEADGHRFVDLGLLRALHGRSDP